MGRGASTTAFYPVCLSRFAEGTQLCPEDVTVDMTEGTRPWQREEGKGCVRSHEAVPRGTRAQMTGSKLCSASFKLCDLNKLLNLSGSQSPHLYSGAM